MSKDSSVAKVLCDQDASRVAAKLRSMIYEKNPSLAQSPNSVGLSWDMFRRGNYNRM